MNENETKKLDQDKLLFIYFHLVWYPFSFLSYSKPLFAHRSIPLVLSTYPYNRMWGGQASTYGVKFKARCLVAYNDEAGEEKTAERHLFMLGTTALREENEIHVLEYVEDTGNVECRQVFNHPSELWDVQPCPSDNRTLFTAYNTGSTMKGTLWGLPDPAEYLEEKDGGGGTSRKKTKFPTGVVLLSLPSPQCQSDGRCQVCRTSWTRRNRPATRRGYTEVKAVAP